MKKSAMILCLLFVAATLTACATYPMPVTATGQQIQAGMKQGTATGVTYLWSFGDASTANIFNAARNGNISRIATVDFKVNNVLNLIQTYTCTVTGE